MFSKRVEKGSQPQNAGKQKWVNIPENTEKSQYSHPLYITTPNKSMKNFKKSRSPLNFWSLQAFIWLSSIMPILSSTLTVE